MASVFSHCVKHIRRQVTSLALPCWLARCMTPQILSWCMVASYAKWRRSYVRVRTENERPANLLSLTSTSYLIHLPAFAILVALRCMGCFRCLLRARCLPCAASTGASISTAGLVNASSSARNTSVLITRSTIRHDLSRQYHISALRSGGWYGW